MISIMAFEGTDYLPQICRQRCFETDFLAARRMHEGESLGMQGLALKTMDNIVQGRIDSGRQPGTASVYRITEQADG